MFVTFIKSVKCFNVCCDESIRKNILFTSCLEKSLMCSLVATGAIKLPVFTYIKSCTTFPTFVIKIHHNFNPSFWSCLNHLIKSTPSKREVDAAIFWITSMGCGCTLLCGCSSQSTCCFRAKNPLRLLDEEDLKPFGFLSYLKKKFESSFASRTPTIWRILLQVLWKPSQHMLSGIPSGRRAPLCSLSSGGGWNMSSKVCAWTPVPANQAHGGLNWGGGSFPRSDGGGYSSNYLHGIAR